MGKAALGRPVQSPGMVSIGGAQDPCAFRSLEGCRMTSARDHDLTQIAAEVEATLLSPGPEQQRLLDRLNEQSARLSKTAFQLAALGQFKRGKSTLLNAFVGYPLLSAGILPLTAVPTFLSRSPTAQIRLKYLSGENL